MPPITLSVPDATVTFDPRKLATRRSAGGCPDNIAHRITLAGNTFFSALDYRVPANLLENAERHLERHDQRGYAGCEGELAMGGSCIPQRTFSADYSLLGVKPVDANKQNPCLNADHAGTPETLRHLLCLGQRERITSNYTGVSAELQRWTMSTVKLNN